MLEIKGMPLKDKPYFDPEKSWVPPMNFDPALRDRMDLRGPFYIYDVTLRDGEQTPGVAFTLDEKIMLAEELDALGVEAVEIGLPMLEKDFKVIQALRKRSLKTKVGCLVRANRAVSALRTISPTSGSRSRKPSARSRPAVVCRVRRIKITATITATRTIHP